MLLSCMLTREQHSVRLPPVAKNKSEGANMATKNEMTPNQIVAYNLARARALRGWTQEVAANHLAKFLALHAKWSRATFSVAEQSVKGVRIREFTADDIFAFARAFELPVTYFLLPPPGVDRFTTVGGESGDDVDNSGLSRSIPPDDFLTAQTVLELVFNDHDELMTRLRELMASRPDEEVNRLAAQYALKVWRDALYVVEDGASDIDDIRSRLGEVVKLLGVLAPAIRDRSEVMMEYEAENIGAKLAPVRYEEKLLAGLSWRTVTDEEATNDAS